MFSKDKAFRSFFFFYVGAAGELSVRVIDSMLGTQPKLWKFTGKTGTDEEAWRQVNLTIGARKHRFQVGHFVKTFNFPQNSSAFLKKTVRRYYDLDDQDLPWTFTSNRMCKLCFSSFFSLVFSSFSLFYLSQLAFEAQAIKISPQTMIKVTNVGFSDCNVEYIPFRPTGEHVLRHLQH